MAPQTLSKSRVTAALALSSFPLAVRAASRSDYISNALNATDVLNQNWYDSTNGLWQDLCAAPSSNGGTWLNDYYDDEAWWALAWIAAFDITQDINYLCTARSIFQDLTTGLDATGGGQWWSKDRDYIASINNELFLAVAASLANRSPNDGTDYRTYAINQADWLIYHSGLMNSDDLFVDGLDPSTCTPGSHTTVWTYNQGAILGGLVELYRLTSDTSYLDTADSIAHGTLLHLTNTGILTEPGYPGPPDATAAHFKGVFVRNLAKLQGVRGDENYVSFLQRNADSIWNSDREGNGEIGPDWQGPLFDASMASQSSGIDCLVAAAAVS
ncbi:hypothetical protein B0A48_11189 [Cryoendolithus antarcticus]|uniref:Mannan endo-1,6-alpha-mannosidase n=1 Tax=Cryoendolithus antarcticus TaxID=1507870 RepID=A0A1V8SUS6_9PEZI|nr:hypothetical protein B0A48_11189 [Cryoendolithus antarcticus]